MPRTIDVGFSDFLKKLTPSSAESAGAQSHRASIQSCLRAAYTLKRFARIGSFGNGTSIYGYSDVDYIAVLSNSDFSTNSSTSLAGIRGTLDRRFPSTGVFVDCPAIVCPFAGTAADQTEIVPAYIQDSSGPQPIYGIPDCAGGWKLASPDAHNAYVHRVDQKHGGRLKSLIRFIKAWKIYRGVPISSFYLELRATLYADSEASIVYPIDLNRFFALLWDKQLASLRDPAGISGLISACPSAAKREDALSKLASALTRSEKARDAERAGNTSDAFDWWRMVYDQQFPTYYY